MKTGCRSAYDVTTDDDVQVSFDLYEGPGQEAMIICPGFFQSKETKTFQRLAIALAENGPVICMDFRGHGRSGGLYTFSAKENADLEAVLKWVKVKYPNITLLGFSLGGAVAINVASHQNGLQSVIAVSAPSAFEEIEMRFWTPEAIQTGLGGLELGAGCRPGNLWLKKERPLDNIHKISPTPILLIHGTEDAIVSHHHSEKLHQAAVEPKRLELIQGGGHAEELFRDDPKRFISLIKRGLNGFSRHPTNCPIRPDLL